MPLYLRMILLWCKHCIDPFEFDKTLHTIHPSSEWIVALWGKNGNERGEGERMWRRDLSPPWRSQPCVRCICLFLRKAWCSVRALYIRNGKTDRSRNLQLWMLCFQALQQLRQFDRYSHCHWSATRTGSLVRDDFSCFILPSLCFACFTGFLNNLST